MLRLTLLVSCCVSLLGCTEEVDACPDPRHVRYADGRCAPPVVQDAGTDAAIDADDASTCDCATSPCLPGGECVECTTDTDCTDRVCDTMANECVQCNTSSDCPPDSPTCTMGSCETGCTDTLCADNFAGSAPACDPDTSGCVACLPDESEGLHCGGMSCDPSTHTCTTTPLGMTGLCEPCVRSTECGTHMTAPMGCVETFFDGVDDPIGTYCLVQRVPIGARCPRGTSERIDRAAVDDPTVANYCAPVTVTTCPAVFSVDGCTDPSTCGHPMLDDAICSEDRCRSRCIVSEPASCGITGETCRTDPIPGVCLR